MERHHKAQSVPLSSSSRAGFNRRVAGVKCCTWLPIQLAFLAFFIICFVYMWCFWKLPKVHDAYPDDFSPCPASSYKILDDQNITIGCTPCPECLSGQQLMPPCGSTMQSEAATACTACPSETYKEGDGIGTCKPCQTCGLRETISQCTSQKNTQCGACPRGYYQEDYTMDSCKKCSTCCGSKRFAELECIYLKQCMRTNCIQYIDIQQNRVLKLEKVAKKFTTPGRIARQRRMAHQSVSQSDNLEDTRNLVLKDLVSQLKKTDFKREVNMTLQREDTVNYPTTMVQEASTTLQDDNSNSPTTATVNDNDHATLSFSFKNKSQNGLDTAPDHNTKEPTLPLASSYFGNIKGLLTILISVSVVGIAILVLVSIAVFIACACWRRQSGHLPGSGCTVTCCAKYIYLGDGEESECLTVSTDTTPPTSGNLMDGTSDNQDREHLENETTKLIDNETVTMLEVPDDPNLLDIPPDLEDILVTSLDVPHNDSEVYGWQKVGNAAEIPPDLLNYYKYAGKSPTKSILEKLGSQGRTISYLIDVLQMPKVQLGSVAENIIRHRATRI